MLKGRLGIETARIPHSDRHGLIWLDRGQLSVEDGCLRFITAGGLLEKGDYRIPHQAISMILLGPGSSVSHDALRLLAYHGTALIAVGEQGTRCYVAPPLSTADSALARKQISYWANPDSRLSIARQMYAYRLNEILPHDSIETLRGIEGARMKEMYRLIANRFGVPWKGRRYDRDNPEINDEPNQAINHAATAVEAAAIIAVYATGTLPPVGFIHEDAGISFILDVADMFRDSMTLPLAFEACAKLRETTGITIDRMIRRMAAQKFHEKQLIPQMIDQIKTLFSRE